MTAPANQTTNRTTGRGPGQPRRRSRWVATGTAVLIVTTAGAAGLAAQAAGSPPPTLALVAASGSATLFEGDFFTDYGTHVVVGDRAFVVEVSRKDLGSPFTATLALGAGEDGRKRALPAGLADTSGLNAFLHLTFRDPQGTVVREEDQDWVPGGAFFGSVRYRPDAPDSSPWPNAGGFSSGDSFALSNVFGLQAGWASSAASVNFEPNAGGLPAGRYTLTETISPAWRKVFGLRAADATATVKLTVVPLPDPGPTGAPRPTPSPPAGVAAGAAAFGAGVGKQGVPSDADQQSARQSRLAEVAAAAAGKQAVLSADPNNRKVPDRRPDLRSNPAFGATVLTSDDFGQDPNAPIIPPGHDYLAFAATVWNAGTSPLVVEGSRVPGSDLMQARQYFYDRSGRQLGWTPVGSMAYDPKFGHQHWHFLDFAQYNLLSSAKQQLVRSQKEAFCLAPTDAIDLLRPDANWQPGSVGLFSQCGQATSLGIREALDVGWGDTYGQFLPGQSFDITDLANGTYFIQVLANPEGNLYETDATNNESLRRIILGGKPGHRTVKVPPYQGNDVP